MYIPVILNEMKNSTVLHCYHDEMFRYEQHDVLCLENFINKAIIFTKMSN